MLIHIVGVCGTFMGSLALLAMEAGFQVSGSDANMYPPMSDILHASGVALKEGYRADNISKNADLVVVGNAISRGNPELEAVLNSGLAYTSGPEWLSRYVLQDKWTLAVAGTHGKTTTTSMLAWILDYAGMNPGFLIGGAPLNFPSPARLGGDFFVVEADEYDTAFFDKRAKFVHYRPRTLILNNLEYDHADIYPDLAAIQRQFHHLIRAMPGNGKIIANASAPALSETLAMGCWTPVESFNSAEGWRLDGKRVLFGDKDQGEALDLALPGAHNRSNALAAIAAARHAGVPAKVSIAALRAFTGVKRRLELRGEAAGVRVYDDFAHHPTAIAATLQTFRQECPAQGRVLAVLEPRSNTMRMGVHKQELALALQEADGVFALEPANLDWSLQDALGPSARVFATVDELRDALVAEARAGDVLLLMSNGGFGGLHDRLLRALRARFS